MLLFKSAVVQVLLDDIFSPFGLADVVSLADTWEADAINVNASGTTTISSEAEPECYQ